MRDIKFRGVEVIEKKMLYGDLIQTNEGCCIRDSDNNIEYVIPETVGQFTGRKDRIGNDIYEGDIVEEELITYDLDKPDGEDEIKTTRRSHVIYTGHGFWINDESFGWEGEGLWNWDKLTVIGNIHSNPDLSTTK